jgi:hypothetical protein
MNAHAGQCQGGRGAVGQPSTSSALTGLGRLAVNYCYMGDVRSVLDEVNQAAGVGLKGPLTHGLTGVGPRQAGKGGQPVRMPPHLNNQLKLAYAISAPAGASHTGECGTLLLGVCVPQLNNAAWLLCPAHALLPPPRLAHRAPARIRLAARH